jgi:hypothetical protein
MRFLAMILRLDLDARHTVTQCVCHILWVHAGEVTAEMLDEVLDPLLAP